jgi:DNA-binding NarL/FixJ family response regulator
MEKRRESFKILLVDDHAVVRAGYRLLLTQTMSESAIFEAARGEEACESFAENAPDLVIMDLNLPGIGGLTAIRRIRARDANARILAFSMHDEQVYVQRALEAGARGYVTKSCDPEILLEAVRKVMAGEVFIEPGMAQRLVVQSMSGVDPAALLNTLSAREFDIFCLLAEGYNVREAAEELHLAYKTVANAITVLKHKLNIDTSAEMAHIAYRHGILKHYS